MYVKRLLCLGAQMCGEVGGARMNECAQYLVAGLMEGELSNQLASNASQPTRFQTTDSTIYSNYEAEKSRHRSGGSV